MFWVRSEAIDCRLALRNQLRYYERRPIFSADINYTTSQLFEKKSLVTETDIRYLQSFHYSQLPAKAAGSGKTPLLHRGYGHRCQKQI